MSTEVTTTSDLIGQAPSWNTPISLRSLTVVSWRRHRSAHWKSSLPQACCAGSHRSWMKHTSVVSSRKCSSFSMIRRSSSVAPTSPSSRPSGGPSASASPRTEAWDVIPDLAVEVISQSNSADEVAGKIEQYFHAGVRQVWVVYLDVRFASPPPIPIVAGQGLMTLWAGEGLTKRTSSDQQGPGLRIADPCEDSSGE